MKAVFAIVLALPAMLCAQEKAVLIGEEGTGSILFGRDPRERFEFSDAFPTMDEYSATVQCQAAEGFSLAYVAEAGRLKSFEWRPCAVTLRDVGAEVKVNAEQCAQQCTASFTALLVDRRGACRVLRPEAR